MPKVLISGGSGFVGSHLCDKFIAEGYEVVCLDNFLTGRTENVEEIQDRPESELLRWDVTQPPEIHGPLDYVLHFASSASPTVPRIEGLRKTIPYFRQAIASSLAL